MNRRWRVLDIQELVDLIPSFARRWVLVFLIVPSAAMVVAVGRRWWLARGRVVLPLDHSPTRGGWWLWLAVTGAELLPALLLALGVLILAGPQTTGPPRTKRSLTNIQIAVDVSGSMTAPYGDGNRYDAAMKAVDKFLDYRKGDAFGLTFFGDAYVHWAPLTADPSAIRCAPPFMRPEIVPPAFGGTAIAKVLRGCLKELRRVDEGDKMILVVTDGVSYDLRDDAELLQLLKAEKITVFAVVAAEFDPQEELTTICHGTGGEAFRADNPDVLKTVFTRISAMTPAKTTPTIAETVDHYRPYALMGLTLAVLHALCLLGLRYTPW